MSDTEMTSEDPNTTTEEMTEDAMREMMGFTGFNTSGRKGGGREGGYPHSTSSSTSTIKAASGANSFPVKARSSEGSGKKKANASTLQFKVPAIPASLTPASLPPPPLSASVPPKPMVPLPPPIRASTNEPSFTSNFSATAILAPPFLPAKPAPPANFTLDSTTNDASGNPYNTNVTIPEKPVFNPHAYASTSTSANKTCSINADNISNYTSNTTNGTSDNNKYRNIRPRVRVNEKGDKAYFKPSFIDPDPWRYAAIAVEKSREKEELRRARERIRKRNQANANGDGKR